MEMTKLMQRFFTKFSRLFRQGWRGLRDWCGDSAYERYARATRKNGPMLSRKEFYVDQLNRRYSRPSRCC
jgi:uncharacterized short protein YbdD (DUF466 family)